MDDVDGALTPKQLKQIAELAKKGFSFSEVGVALGFTQAQIAQVLGDEQHPFNRAYWDAKIEYTSRLRSVAMNIVEHSVDDSVRVKMLEILAKENTDAFEHKLQYTGYTDIRKLLSVVRQQFHGRRQSSRSSSTSTLRRKRKDTQTDGG